MLADGDGEKLSAVKNYTAVEMLSDPRDIYAYGSGGHHVTDSPRKTTSWKKLASVTFTVALHTASVTRTIVKNAPLLFCMLSWRAVC